MPLLAVRLPWFLVLLDAVLIAFYGFVVFGVVQYYWRRRRPTGDAG